MLLSAIHVYPVKSLGGISLSTAQVEARGLQHDRRWMLVNPEGRFLTQRELPRMATISVALGQDALELSAPERKPLSVPLQSFGSPAQSVRVWRSVCLALPVSEESDRWFTEFLGMTCRLVYMPEETRRTVNPEYAAGEGIVSFADGYPLMILGEASLQDLNSRLKQPVPMNRFRPNLVVTGIPAYAEDTWKTVRIGTTVFHVVKPCDRCLMTTVNQETGKTSSPDPLKTLASYRQRDQKVLFGQFIIPNAPGIVRVGDMIEVV